VAFGEYVRVDLWGLDAVLARPAVMKGGGQQVEDAVG
jgi:hypothetical protein